MVEPNPQSDPATPPGGSDLPPTETLRQLVLVKQGQRYIFRYRDGDEPKLLEGLVQMVRDPGSGLDWFDAAVLSHQMGRQFSRQLDRVRKGLAADGKARRRKPA